MCVELKLAVAGVGVIAVGELDFKEARAVNGKVGLHAGRQNVALLKIDGGAGGRDRGAHSIQSNCAGGHAGLHIGKGDVLLAGAGDLTGGEIFRDHFLPALLGVHRGGGLIKADIHAGTCSAADMP